MGEIVGTIADVPGDFPGRVRIPITEGDGEAQLGLIYALRSRHYSSAATARCAYPAQDLTALDSATEVTVASRASVRHGDLSTGPTPVLLTDLDPGGALTHTGTNRVWAWVYSSSSVPPKVRLVHDVGDMILPEENDWVQLPGSSNWYLVDLGEVRLDPSPVGDHRWRGQIQAKGATGGENVAVARVFVLSAGEFYGVLRASLAAAVNPGLVEYAARDEFNQSSGNLAGKTAPVGGVWAGAGDSDDFAVETTGKTAQRTAVSDAGTNGGRYAVPGSMAALGATVARVDFKASGDPIGGNNRVGLVARYTDANNWVRLLSYGFSRFALEKSVSGVITSVATQGVTGPQSPLPDISYTMALMVLADGLCLGLFGTQGGPLETVIIGKDAALATGGALAAGKAGIYDAFSDPGAAAATRNYDAFAVWVPELDAVIHPNRSVELRWDGIYRDDADGVGSGTLVPLGDNPRLPPSGLEGRTAELFILSSTGDLKHLPDA